MLLMEMQDTQKNKILNKNITSASYYRQIAKHIKGNNKWKPNQKKGFAETYLYQKYSVLASIFLVICTCVFPLQHHSPSLLGVICLCLLEPFLETVDLHHLSSCSWQRSVYSFLEENLSRSLFLELVPGTQIKHTLFMYLVPFQKLYFPCFFISSIVISQSIEHTLINN